MPEIQVDRKPVSWLKANISKTNLCDEFNDNVLSLLGAEIIDNYKADKSTQDEWADRITKGLEVAMQVATEKTFPWPKAANTKDPLIAEAAMQFAARAGAEIVKNTDVVRTKVTGSDPTSAKELRGKRVGTYMSYECTDLMPDWQSDTEQLLTSLPIIGSYYKKTYRDEVQGYNCSVSVSPLKLIVPPNIKGLKTSPRISEEIDDFTYNDIIERIRVGAWRDITDRLKEDKEIVHYKFVEQHCWYDLDGDGYREPYVITVHVDTLQVVRIIARYDETGITEGKQQKDVEADGVIKKIEPIHYYTEFAFLYSPDAKFHKVGFAHLLGPLTETINTTQNQLLDAGLLSNLNGGFIGKGARLPGGRMLAKPFEWKEIDIPGQQLRDNLVPFPVKEPSAVLLNLRNVLSDSARKLATISDTMQGDMPGANVPATTTLALLDQGLKVFSWILKRMYRSFKDEYMKLYRLNYYYLTDKEYLTVIDVTPEDVAYFQSKGIDINNLPEGSRAIVQMDFNLDDCDVQPVMDPTAASEALRLAKANAIHQAAPQSPAALRLYLKAIGVPDTDIDAIVPKDPPPNPEMVKLQADIMDKQQQGEIAMHKLKNEAASLAIKELELSYKMMLIEAQAINQKATAEKTLAESEAIQVTTHLDVFRTQLAELQQQFEQSQAAIKAQIEEAQGGGENGESDSAGDEQQQAPGMDGDGGNANGDGMAAGQAASAGGNAGGGAGVNVNGAGGNGVDLLGGNYSGGMPNTRPADVASAESKSGSMI